MAVCVVVLCDCNRVSWTVCAYDVSVYVTLCMCCDDVMCVSSVCVMCDNTMHIVPHRL